MYWHCQRRPGTRKEGCKLKSDRGHNRSDPVATKKLLVQPFFICGVLATMPNPILDLNLKCPKVSCRQHCAQPGVLLRPSHVAASWCIKCPMKDFHWQVSSQLSKAPHATLTHGLPSLGSETVAYSWNDIQALSCTIMFKAYA